MKPAKPPASRELTALLDRYAPDVQATAYAARRLLFATIPGTMEVIDRNARVIGYGYGTGYRDMICTLIFSKREVKLGLIGGATLPDPRGLMRGAGKVHRHVPLASTQDLTRPGLRSLLKAAVSHWRRRAQGA